MLATGAFDVFIQPGSDHPYLNYAIPRPGAEPDEEAVGGADRDHGGRRPRPAAGVPAGGGARPSRRRCARRASRSSCAPP